MVGAWALPTLIVYGTPEQQERWIPPTLRGEIKWCQLFSEPGAGSDLAVALDRRRRASTAAGCSTARRCGRRWRRQADWGICLARTDPDAPEARRHLVLHGRHEDRRASTSGRCASSPATTMFNEVFFDDVFVPDDCLVGEEHDGWRCARTTLANERVFMGGSNTIGGGVVGAADARSHERGLEPTTGSRSTRSATSPSPATRSRCSASA